MIHNLIHPDLALSRVAVLDDDLGMQTMLHRVLSSAFVPTIVRSGRELLTLVESKGTDIILLDLRLPGEDGLELLRAIRASSPIPIIIVTGTANDSTVEVGLNLGADDYVVKPFAPQVLLARIRSVLRRAVKTAQATLATAPAAISFGDASFFPGLRQIVSARRETHPVTEREAQILKILCEKGTDIASRDEISRQVSGYDWDPSDRSLDVHVCRLRSKLAIATDQRVSIDPVRGVGYRLRVMPLAER